MSASPVKFRIEVQGVAAFDRKVDRLIAPRFRQEVGKTIRELGLALQRSVKRNYLRGPRPQRLGRVTGVLGDSINLRVEETPAKVVASVGTNVWYGKMWETTGHGPIVPKRAKMLAWKTKGRWHRARYVSAQGPRPFLRPAWLDMKPIAIREISASLKRAGRP